MENAGKHSLSVDKYLQRIGYEGSKETNITNLAEIQRAHIHNVPYENLDILAGKHLSLAVEALYEKIAIKKKMGILLRAQRHAGMAVKRAKI